MTPSTRPPTGLALLFVGSARAAAAAALVMGLCAAAALPVCHGQRDDGTATVVVFAAASLTDVFGDLERDFEAAHPGVDVVVSVAGSQTLAVQIEQGAPADVFASADLAHAQRLADEGLVAEPLPLAAASVVAIVPAANPLGVTTPADFARVSRVVVGDDRVPIGAYTAQLLTAARASAADAAWAAHVSDHIVSREPSVRAVRAKVALGEADLGFVYAPDANDAADVRAVALPAGLAPRAAYAIALTTAGEGRDEAQAFMLFALSSPGAATLRAHGFDPPGAP
ncbi:MAG: molybdate ABC transporter substrate-binding protein [Myxococcales bacterium]|nr:molybdate ABC transporter substrate-binding protein [Myxococcales bacterium]